MIPPPPPAGPAGEWGRPALAYLAELELVHVPWAGGGGGRVVRWCCRLRSDRDPLPLLLPFALRRAVVAPPPLHLPPAVRGGDGGLESGGRDRGTAVMGWWPLPKRTTTYGGGTTNLRGWADVKPHTR
eukprot:gene14337-biopygen2063